MKSSLHILAHSIYNAVSLLFHIVGMTKNYHSNSDRAKLGLEDLHLKRLGTSRL